MSIYDKLQRFNEVLIQQFQANILFDLSCYLSD